MNPSVSESIVESKKTDRIAFGFLRFLAVAALVTGMAVGRTGVARAEGDTPAGAQVAEATASSSAAAVDVSVAASSASPAVDVSATASSASPAVDVSAAVSSPAAAVASPAAQESPAAAVASPAAQESPAAAVASPAAQESPAAAVASPAAQESSTSSSPSVSSSISSDSSATSNSIVSDPITNPISTPITNALSGNAAVPVTNINPAATQPLSVSKTAQLPAAAAMAPSVAMPALPNAAAANDAAANLNAAAERTAYSASANAAAPAYVPDPYFTRGTITHRFLTDCSGQTVDATNTCTASATPIQAALNDVAANGHPNDSTVYVEGGDYAEDVTIDGLSNITVAGSVNNITSRLAGVVSVANASSVRLRNFFFASAINLANVAEILLEGTTGDDSLVVNLLGSARNVTLDGRAGSDSYRVRLGGFVSSLFISDSGTSGTDSLVLEGTSGNDTLRVGAGVLTGGADRVSYDGTVENLAVDGRDGNDSITVDGAVNAAGNVAFTSETITVNETLATSGGSLMLSAPAGVYLSGTSGQTLTLRTSGGRLSLAGPVVLGSAVLLSSSGGDIEFASILDGAHDLIVDAGSGSTLFGGAVGGITPLGDGSGYALQLRSSGATIFGSSLRTASGIYAAGPVTFLGDATLQAGDTPSLFEGAVTLGGVQFSALGGVVFAAPVQLTQSASTVSTGGAQVRFGSTLAGAQNLTVDSGGGATIFAGAVSGLGTGSGYALRLLSSGLTTFGGALTANAGMYAAGPVAFSANATLGGSTASVLQSAATLANAVLDAAAGVTFGGAVDVSGAAGVLSLLGIVFAGAVDGAGTLNLSTPGALSAAGAIGARTRLRALTISGGSVQLRNGLHAGSATISSGGDVWLGGTSSVTEGGLEVQNSGTFIIDSGAQVVVAGNFTRAGPGAAYINGTLTAGSVLVSAFNTSNSQAGPVFVSGTVRSASITLLGASVQVLDGALLDARGAAGGGSIYVGGGWQGAGLPQATSTYVAAGAVLDASATDNGNGGTVVVWSDVTNASCHHARVRHTAGKGRPERRQRRAH